VAWLRPAPLLALALATAPAVGQETEYPLAQSPNLEPPRALAPEPPAPSGILVVAGFDVGSYGIGSGLTGASLDAKVGLGFRTAAGVALALIGEADYGAVNLPIRASTGNYWLLPQLDLALIYQELRLHAFVGAGWGRFQRVTGDGQREVVLYGGGVGFGWGCFDANVRWLAPDSALKASGAGPERETVPGIGAQLTLGMRFDLVP
jgi:hypothetical protein